MDIQKDGSDRHALFVSLLVKNQAAIFGYILSLLPHWSDAEDVLQQTSVVLWERFDDFDVSGPADSFARWGCRVAHYKILNHRKKNARNKHIFSDDLLRTLAEQGVEESEQLARERRALQGCLEKLSQRQQSIMRACYAGTQKIYTVAEQLGRSPGSLYKMLHQIRGILLQCVERVLAVEENGHEPPAV